MKALKSVLLFYVYSNVHVAVAGFCLTRITQLAFDMKPSVLPWFVALAIIASYNLIRMTDRGKKPDSWLSKWLRQHQTVLLVLTGIALSGMGLLLIFSAISINTVLTLTPFGLMTLFYAIPVGKVRGKVVSLRRIPGVKIFSIGLAWTGVTVLVPFVEADFPLDTQFLLAFLQRLCFLIAITIPFDIRDMERDLPALKTIPQVFGLQGAKRVGYSLVLVFVFLALYQQQSLNMEFTISAVIGLVIIYCLELAEPTRNRFFTSFWVESIPVVWFVLISVFLSL